MFKMRAKWVWLSTLGPVSLVAFVACVDLDAPGACGLRPEVCATPETGAVDSGFVEDTASPAETSPSPDVAVEVEAETAPSLAKVNHIAVGKTHVCALLVDKSVWCWGSNGRGELGRDLTTTATSVPVKVTLPGAADDVAAGSSFSCALVGGEIYCWGANSVGQSGLPVPATAYTSTPHRIDGTAGVLSGIKAITAGDAFGCGLNVDGSVQCWGGNEHGQLGNSMTSPSPTASDVFMIKTASFVAAGGATAFAVVYTDGVRCWGASDAYQLGNAGTGDYPVPTGPSGTTKWSAFALGSSHACGIATDASLYCWGDNGHAQTGQPLATTQVKVPTKFSGAGLVDRVVGADYHTCWLSKDKTISCIGGNAHGQLGNGSVADSVATPQKLSLAGVTSLSAGGSTTCAVDGDQHLWCWGANDKGQLGDGTLEEHPAPTLVKW